MKKSITFVIQDLIFKYRYRLEKSEEVSSSLKECFVSDFSNSLMIPLKTKPELDPKKLLDLIDFLREKEYLFVGVRSASALNTQTKSFLELLYFGCKDRRVSHYRKIDVIEGAPVLSSVVKVSRIVNLADTLRRKGYLVFDCGKGQRKKFEEEEEEEELPHVKGEELRRKVEEWMNQIRSVSTIEEAQKEMTIATESLRRIKKGDFYTIKSFNIFTYGVQIVIEALCILFQVRPNRKISKRNKVELDYITPGKRLIRSPYFLSQLIRMDVQNLTDVTMEKLRDYIVEKGEDFNPDVIMRASRACGNLSTFLVAICKYHFLHRRVLELNNNTCNN